MRATQHGLEDVEVAGEVVAVAVSVGSQLKGQRAVRVRDREATVIVRLAAEGRIEVDQVDAALKPGLEQVVEGCLRVRRPQLSVETVARFASPARDRCRRWTRGGPSLRASRGPTQTHRSAGCFGCHFVSTSASVGGRKM